MSEFVIFLVVIAGFIVFWAVLWFVSSGRTKTRPASPPTKRAPKSTQSQQVLALGYAKRQRVTMEYETRHPLPGEPARKVRDIDIYGLDNGYFDAFCHYRNEVRTFKISRVLRARLTSVAYQIPATYGPSDLVRYGWGEVQDTQ